MSGESSENSAQNNAEKILATAVDLLDTKEDSKLREQEIAEHLQKDIGTQIDELKKPEHKDHLSEAVRAAAQKHNLPSEVVFSWIYAEEISALTVQMQELAKKLGKKEFTFNYILANRKKFNTPEAHEITRKIQQILQYLGYENVPLSGNYGKQKKEATSVAVMSLQKLLRKEVGHIKEHENLAPDGLFGKHTLSALLEFLGEQELERKPLEDEESQRREVREFFAQIDPSLSPFQKLEAGIGIYKNILPEKTAGKEEAEKLLSSLVETVFKSLDPALSWRERLSAGGVIWSALQREVKDSPAKQKAEELLRMMVSDALQHPRLIHWEEIKLVLPAGASAAQDFLDQVVKKMAEESKGIENGPFNTLDEEIVRLLENIDPKLSAEEQLKEAFQIHKRSEIKSSAAERVKEFLNHEESVLLVARAFREIRAEGGKSEAGFTKLQRLYALFTLAPVGTKTHVAIYDLYNSDGNIDREMYGRRGLIGRAFEEIENSPLPVRLQAAYRILEMVPPGTTAQAKVQERIAKIQAQAPRVPAMPASATIKEPYGWKPVTEVTDDDPITIPASSAVEEEEIPISELHPEIGEQQKSISDDKATENNDFLNVTPIRLERPSEIAEKFKLYLPTEQHGVLLILARLTDTEYQIVPFSLTNPNILLKVPQEEIGIFDDLVNTVNQRMPELKINLKKLSGQNLPEQSATPVSSPVRVSGTREYIREASKPTEIAQGFQSTLQLEGHPVAPFIYARRVNDTYEIVPFSAADQNILLKIPVEGISSLDDLELLVDARKREIARNFEAIFPKDETKEVPVEAPLNLSNLEVKINATTGRIFVRYDSDGRHPEVKVSEEYGNLTVTFPNAVTTTSGFSGRDPVKHIDVVKYTDDAGKPMVKLTFQSLVPLEVDTIRLGNIALRTKEERASNGKEKPQPSEESKTPTDQRGFSLRKRRTPFGRSGK